MRGAKRFLPRVALVAAAVAAAVLLISWQREADECDEASRPLLAAAEGERPSSADLDEAVARVRKTCEPEGLRRGAALLVAARDERAAPLAREAAREEPRNFRTWVTLSTALERSDPAGAERARRRATALNPRLAAPPER